tara:strand:+ start:274 stop:537 length:264 start_codon:yes stop_codon:yes gene_type:complete
MKIEDTLNIGSKFIITYRPFTHNGEERKKLKDGKTTRQITRKAKWDNKCKVVRDKISDKLRYVTYYDLKADNYRCATGQIWITGGIN